MLLGRNLLAFFVCSSTPEPTSSSGLQSFACKHSCNISCVRVFLAIVWFLDRSFLNFIFVLVILNSNSILNVIYFPNVNVAWCSSIVVVSASLSSADFDLFFSWPILSPSLYPSVLGSFSKADALKTCESFSIHSRRHDDFSLCVSLQFTFSIENGVQFIHLIFQWFFIDADLLTSYYLSQSSLMNSYCLLAVYGIHRLGFGREIRFTVFLSRVYPGVSSLPNFSGFASIFCTAV